MKILLFVPPISFCTAVPLHQRWENGSYCDGLLNNVVTEFEHNGISCGHNCGCGVAGANGWKLDCQQNEPALYWDGSQVNVTIEAYFDGVEAETFEKCKTVYLATPETALETSITAQPDSSYKICIRVTSRDDNTTNCTASINDNVCSLCEMTPCHVFYGPEYILDCSNVVSNVGIVDTCAFTGMEGTIFAYWPDSFDDLPAGVMRCGSFSQAAMTAGLATAFMILLSLVLVLH